MTGADGQTIDVMANLERQRAERHRHRSESAAVDTAPGKPAGESKADGVAAETTAAPKGRSEDAKRWDTLNEFEDEIAPHLTLAEQAVWHYLFSHCRSGRAEGSVRLIAQGRRIDFKTGAAALRHLIAVGLVREILKSVSKYARSVYGINSHPAACLTACVQVDAGRKARRKERKPPPIRDKESRLRSANKAKPKPR